MRFHINLSQIENNANIFEVKQRKMMTAEGVKGSPENVSQTKVTKHD